MKLAASDGDSMYIPALRSQTVVYTPVAVMAQPGGAPEKQGSREFAHATV
jgi:hypothetical protein